MRSTSFFFVLLFAICFSSFNGLAQKSIPTTLDEYIYGAVGYKLQLQAKLDMKIGYSLISYDPCEDPEHKVEFKGLQRDGEIKPCAIIMTYQKYRGAPHYYCIPTADADPDLWKKFYKSLEADLDNPQEILQFISMCLGKFSIQMATK